MSEVVFRGSNGAFTALEMMGKHFRDVGKFA